MSNFNLKTKFSPAGDQPKAIENLTKRIEAGFKSQTLLGITGSGKTFSMANVIQNTGKPTLVLSHNKTLAAQLFSEFREFFPDNHVEYFVSYYDYYQPEAYVPRRDLYIEKEVEINESIERYRSSATQSLLSHKDVIVVATVSCIYGLGNPEDYMSLSRTIEVGQSYERSKFLRHLADLQYERRSSDFFIGTFRVRGDVVDINTASEETGVRIEYFGDEIEAIKVINPLTGQVIEKPSKVTIFPAKAFVTPYQALKEAIPKIRNDLEKEVKSFKEKKMLLEAERLRQRVEYDLEMLQEIGYVSGIENYSRYIENRPIGSPPSTLIDYFPDDWILMVDESHITIPQVHGMYNGDYHRKKNLVDHGFRLKAAFDNRPLKFKEFYDRINQVIYVSATPKEFEIKESHKSPIIKKLQSIDVPNKLTEKSIVKQIIRPTGLIDPQIDVRPSEPQYLKQLQKFLKKYDYKEMTYHPDNKEHKAVNQIDDLVYEIKNTIKRKERVLITTLTKKMAENLSSYLKEQDIKTTYLHSEIDTIERVEILQNLRLGTIDVVVGINLLREGIDLPEVSLIAIIDADKEGFLRSEISLIQTIGRASRNMSGRVIMYADKITGSMKRAIETTLARRKKQIAYNRKHNITPKTIKKAIKSQFDRFEEDDKKEKNEINLIKKFEAYPAMSKKERKQYIAELKVQMDIYADMMEFEKAAEVRDLLKEVDAL
ncbi:excinuclease ABC subunit B [Candidatus Dojkabacteria bacterium]|nr:excinuclease ABC subunit B [Candidatus Dojkabacteria bacterium]